MNGDHYHHLSDQQLLEKFQSSHDNKWLGILLQRYTLLLFGVCMKYLKNEDEARDAVQQVFLKVIQELKKYKVDYFKSWLYMIAKNYCLMQLRTRQQRSPAELTENLIATPDEGHDQEAFLKNEQALELVELGLRELNPEQQQCVTLFYLQKKSYLEITEITGFSLLQVKSYIQNGKRNLKIWIERRLNTETD